MGVYPYNAVYKEKRSDVKIEPFTFGIVATGIFGGGLLVITAMEKSGMSINEDLLVIVVEVIKAGAFLKLISLVSKLFL
ncbi:hypothetical protein KYJ26_14330 [Bacillus sp. MCCB 382]|uniref:hypothetical protein n=1 Tax=Bacillus sp. MCCB 382 TaxID=2860197 RepID=UPI001C56BC26|nr:hypothetical protein [Bacillus sp. MCCB 382]